MDEKIANIVEMIDAVVTDTSVPRNIRKALSDAKERLLSDDDISVKVSAAIYLIEPVSEDVNMPSHARTQIWAIMSALESIKQ